jgi:hypothetical protein
MRISYFEHKYFEVYENKHSIKNNFSDPLSDEGVYTYPMHPEIKQNKPGICPKCRISLERIAKPSSYKVLYTCLMHRKGNLNGIVRAIALSRSTVRNIRQNLFFCLYL